MTSPTSVLPADLLYAAIAADEALWDLSDDRRAHWLSVRNSAVRAAVVAGHSREELARALRMSPADIDRIISTGVQLQTGDPSAVD